MNVLVLDLGSSSSRAIVCDEHARPVPGCMARAALDFNSGPDGRSTDDAAAALRRAAEVARRSLDLAGDPPITATSLSVYAASLVCLDDRGEPISPVLTYADTRAAADAATLRREHDELGVLQRTGCRIRSNYHPARLAWLRRSMPDVFARTRWFAGVGDFVRMRMTGARAPRTSLSLASWTGLLDRTALDWDGRWIEALGIAREQLPQLDGGASDGWFAYGDGAAANIGAGCADAGRIAVTIGSTGAVRITAPLPPEQIPSPLWCYRIDSLRALLGGATTEGGNVVAWMERALALGRLSEREDELAAMQPDGHGLTVLPMFAGERSPGFADAATATLHGLRLDSTPLDIARAALEAIAYRLAQICDAVRGVASPDAELVATGGALSSAPTWRHIIADAAGLPLRVCEEPEATSRGAAVLALEALGANSAEPARLSAPIEPDMRRHAIYRDAMRRQQGLYARLQH